MLTISSIGRVSAPRLTEPEYMQPVTVQYPSIVICMMLIACLPVLRRVTIL